MTPNLELEVHTRVIVRKDSYHDSVLLMRISRELKALEGVDDAVVAMGTPHNKELLLSTGYTGPDLEQSGPNDLIIAVRSEGTEIEEIEEKADDLLAGNISSDPTEIKPATIADAIQTLPEANLVLISVPGEYAAREARKALSKGLHVMLFSDNVSLEDEIALKNEAASLGLLCMGPDCGTAIINGKPLAFANVVRQGSIGIVGASGTGIQEVTCCIHNLGGGVSQAIGTGGRDLKDGVGGKMMLLGIEALAEDPATTVLAVISKPPSPTVAQKVIEKLIEAGKPSVVHFVGAESRSPEADGRVVFADSLAAAAEDACRLAKLDFPEPESIEIYSDLIDTLAAKLDNKARLCGLFCGGTTGYEGLVLLERAGIEVYSNLHKGGPRLVAGTETVDGHVVLDLGADVFTDGRPHPMIEPALRNERLIVEMADPNVRLLLFDVMLGYGSHEDPGGLMAEAVIEARKETSARGQELVAIGSITGTELDPQKFEDQKSKLEKAGVILMANNLKAVELAAAVLGRIE